MELFHAYYLIVNSREVKYIYEHVDGIQLYIVTVSYSDVIPRFTKRFVNSKTKENALDEVIKYWESKKNFGLIEMENRLIEQNHSKWINSEKIKYEAITVKKPQCQEVTEEINPFNTNVTHIEVFQNNASLLKSINSILHYNNVIRPKIQHTQPITDEQVIQAITSIIEKDNE